MLQKLINWLESSIKEICTKKKKTISARQWPKRHKFLYCTNVFYYY